MIRSVRLGNFKCFEDGIVPLERLTLLSGINGAGKSSVVQALLVLRQIYLRGAFTIPGAGQDHRVDQCREGTTRLPKDGRHWAGALR